MRHYFHRHQPFSSFTKALLAGFGGCLAIGILSFLTTHTGYALMMAPFGASCVLLFSLPNSPLSQPMNVFFGHLASALVGLLCATLLPDIWWAVALAVGGAISVMALLRITHPPAGADPIVVFAAHARLAISVHAGCAGIAVVDRLRRAVSSQSRASLSDAQIQLRKSL
ncbi:HPP family protein [Agrobacterium vitis]|uniref:HPP family protein n=1 Tax=Agrobacterium vitis TaxID=373 RepID=UPI0030E19CDB